MTIARIRCELQEDGSAGRVVSASRNKGTTVAFECGIGHVWSSQDVCWKCHCLTTAHHGPAVGCEGAGGNCGCTLWPEEAAKMPTVQQEGQVRFIEYEGQRYTSDDFPPEGTEVEVEPYTGIDDNPWADFSWSNSSPSGRGFARVQADL